MKTRVLFGLSVAVLSLASLASASTTLCVTPGPNPDNLPTCNPITSRVLPSDPFTYSVTEGPVSIFSVPVLAGDIVLCDDPAVACDASHSGNWGDVLRFLSTGATSGNATLFSDANEIGSVTPGDIDLTTLTLQPLRLFLFEVGTEANNGIAYDNGDSIGTITSDGNVSVPEPATILLLGSGLLMARRRSPKTADVG